MCWNNMVYGSGCGCGNDNNVGGESTSPCNGTDLLEGVSKNDCVKIYLRNGSVVKGFFAGINGNTVTLFNCDRDGVSTTTICVDDIAAVKTFSKHPQCCD